MNALHLPVDPSELVPDEMVIEYQETGRQPYGGNDCVFSAGLCDGHPIDSMYIRLERGTEEPIMILFRPDEMMALGWLINGALWSWQMREMGAEEMIE